MCKPLNSATKTFRWAATDLRSASSSVYSVSLDHHENLLNSSWKCVHGSNTTHTWLGLAALAASRSRSNLRKLVALYTQYRIRLSS